MEIMTMIIYLIQLCS